MLVGLCHKCTKPFHINPTHKVHFKLGCVCPNCKTIMNAEKMLDNIIRAQPKGPAN